VENYQRHSTLDLYDERWLVMGKKGFWECDWGEIAYKLDGVYIQIMFGLCW
jgi:hypothetical protein